VLLRSVLWNLADSKTTSEELRPYLRDESVDQLEEVRGLRFKAWISDEVTDAGRRSTSRSRRKRLARSCRAERVS
jgi:hypothetical protein